MEFVLTATRTRLDQPVLQLVEAAPRAAAEKAPVLQDVYQRLREDIFEFRMPPGQRYSEHELAAALGVSRTPMRLALHVLAREGYLVRLDGHSSWQVKPLDLAYYEDLYEFRTDIEAIAARRLCKRDPLPDLAGLRDYWRTPKARRTTDFRQVAAQDEQFHQTLVALAGNQEMLRSFNELTERIRIIRRLDFLNPDRIDATFEEHGKILDALRARKADRAELLIRAHIATSRTEIRHITLHRLALAASRSARQAV